MKKQLKKLFILSMLMTLIVSSNDITITKKMPTINILCDSDMQPTEKTLIN